MLTRLIILLSISSPAAMTMAAQCPACAASPTQGRLSIRDTDLPQDRAAIVSFTITLQHASFFSLEPLPVDWDIQIRNRHDGESVLTATALPGAMAISGSFFADMDVQVRRYVAAEDDTIEAGARVTVLKPDGSSQVLPYGPMSFSFSERQARRKLHIQHQ